jgi:hypothetical protein
MSAIASTLLLLVAVLLLLVPLPLLCCVLGEICVLEVAVLVGIICDVCALVGIEIEMGTGVAAGSWVPVAR